MFTPARPQLPLPRTTLPPLSSILSNDQFNLLDFTPKHDMKRKFSAIANINTTTNSATTSATSSATTSAATSNAPTTANTPSATPTTISPTTAGGKSYAFISHSPATFPSQEPAIDNAPLARRKRRRTSANELSILNREFDNGSTPNKLKRIQIAKLVNMSEKAVQIWFQNKRQSLRKQFKSELEITELPPTPSIYSSSTAASSTTSLYSAADTSTTFLSGFPTPLSIQTAPIISHQMSPIVCSTPTKPILNKSQSFIVSPSVQIASPIRQRAQSIPITQATPIADYDESIDSIDDSYIAQKTLVETKKKQPNYLQKYTKNQCLTFKLTSSTSSNKISQKLANAANEASNQSKCKITNILNTRKPLGEINLNTDKKKCVESLISLKAGNWN